MLLLFLSAASLFTVVHSQYACSSVASMTHTMTGCPANEGFPDCAYIQANSAAICSTLLTSWEIVNGQTCNLRGASYGCIYATGQYSTTDEFCCPLVPMGGASSPLPTATPSFTGSSSSSASTSASASASSSATGSASATSSATSSATVTLSASVSISPSTTTSVTVTPSTTSTPSHINTTIITLTQIVETELFSKGIMAAIGIASIFGIGTLMGFCYFCLFCILRRRPMNNQRFTIERLPSILAAIQNKSTVADVLNQGQDQGSRKPSQALTVERRSSMAAVINQIEKDKESRKPSQLQIRLPEVSAV